MRVVLQPRDYEIFTLFLTLRLISAADIYVLVGQPFEQPFVLWRRLNRLYHAGYLTRPPEQQWRLRKSPGNTELVYSLGNKGAQALARLGYKLPKIDWDQKAKEWKPYSFDHPLLVSRFLTCTSLGVQRTPGLEIVELIPEGHFRDTVTFFDGKEEVTLPLKPDATLVIEDRRNGQTDMPLQRTTFKQSSFYKKLVAYLHYWLQGDRFKERLGVDDFVVLTVGEDEAASLILRDFAQEADEEKRGTSLFWFSSLPALSREHPEKVLLDDIWTTAAGERGSIF